MQEKKREVDMLNGPLAGKIVRFALPVAAASILQQLFNSADLAVVGRFDNSTAMAAVGSNAALINLLVSLFAGLSLGGTVVVASLIGSGKREKINEAIHTSITLAIVSGLIVTAIGEIFAPILLRLMNTPDEVLRLASLYLRIFFLAVPLFLVYDFGASILRAKGDSTRPLYALIASGLINVVLNILFVAGFDMGVAGVAIATDISNVVSSGMILYFLCHEEETFRLSFRKLGIRREYFRRIVAIGAPAGLQGMVFSLSNVMIQSAINGFGATAIAGNTAGQNFEYMCYFVVNGFVQAATTFTSQNFAAGKTDRCKKIYRQSLFLAVVFSFSLALVFYFGRGIFVRIFTTDPEVLEYAYLRLVCICLFEELTGTYEIPGGCLRGMNHSLTPAVITILGSCVLRLVWIATVFQAYHSMVILLIVYPVSWVVTGTSMNIAYFSMRKKEFARLPQPA
ncbi:MAG: MATE family efflux transporter [Bilifractor sp.]|jgi:putative MATE family efflux protein